MKWKTGTLVGSVVIWSVISLKGGVRKEAPSQIYIDLCLVGMWIVLLTCKAGCLGVGSRVSVSVCLCICVYMCPERGKTWEGRSPSGNGVADSAQTQED